jgi:DNA-binding LacI/PurR family transcriptional regulator
MKETETTTIRDVARHANVSIATVSRVLNNYPGVSEETRGKVRATIEALEYTPNPIARQLSIGRTLTIGLILPYITMPSYIDRLRGVQQILASSEYDLVIFTVDNPVQRNAYFTDLSRKTRVDGMLIVSLPPNDQQAEYFTRSRVPTVLIDSSHSQLCCVAADDIEGGRIATRHLVALGHRRIAYLSDLLDTPFHPAMQLRHTGYCQVLAENKIPYRPEYVIEGLRGRTNAKALAKKLLSLAEPPTAIFAASDTQAFGVLDAAKELDLRVPEQLSVIGYDNIRDSGYYNLTTIDQSLYESGAAGGQMLLDLLTGDLQPPCTESIEVSLLQRDTTAEALS